MVSGRVSMAGPLVEYGSGQITLPFYFSKNAQSPASQIATLKRTGSELGYTKTWGTTVRPRETASGLDSRTYKGFVILENKQPTQECPAGLRMKGDLRRGAGARPTLLI